MQSLQNKWLISAIARGTQWARLRVDLQCNNLHRIPDAMTRRATLIDVARLAGVSKSTVSLVVNGSPSVRADTAARVRQAMADCGYVYNRAAANLRSASVGLIGIVVDDLRDPAVAEIVVAAQAVLAAQGYGAVVAHSAADPATEAAAVRSMIEHGVTGLLIRPVDRDGSDSFAAIRRAGLACVQVLNDAATDVPLVSFDYAGAGQLAATHLMAGLPRGIAVVGGMMGDKLSETVMAGCCAALGNRRGGQGNWPAPVRIPGPQTQAFGRQVAADLRASHPQIAALIGMNDAVALGLHIGLARSGCADADIDLITIGGGETVRDLWPGIDAVICDYARLGRESAMALLDWVETGEHPLAHRDLPVTLSVGRTGADGTVRP